jgi:hypothetical protein
MHELSLNFTGEPNQLMRVNTDLMASRLRDEIEEVLANAYQRIEVDVSSSVSFSPYSEWRLNVPPNELELYVRIGRLIKGIDEFCESYVERGCMIPRSYVVTIWTLPLSEESIIGSND